jgi:hypothetical protein
MKRCIIFLLLFTVFTTTSAAALQLDTVLHIRFRPAFCLPSQFSVWVEDDHLIGNLQIDSAEGAGIWKTLTTTLSSSFLDRYHKFFDTYQFPDSVMNSQMLKAAGILGIADGMSANGYYSHNSTRRSFKIRYGEHDIGSMDLCNMIIGDIDTYFVESIEGYLSTVKKMHTRRLTSRMRKKRTSKS